MGTETFGGRLTRAREAIGLSRAQVAERIGMSIGAVQLHENCEREPDFDTIEIYLRMYNIDANWLFTGFGKAPGKSKEPDPFEDVVELVTSAPKEELPRIARLIRANKES